MILFSCLGSNGAFPNLFEIQTEVKWIKYSKYLKVS